MLRPSDEEFEMALNRLLYTLAVIAAIAFSAVYKSRISAIILIAVLCYPIPALIMVIISCFCVKAGFTDSQSKTYNGSPAVFLKGESFDLWIYVRNKSIIPCCPIEIIGNLPDRETGFFTQKRIYTSVPPLGKFRIAVPSMHRYRGAYKADISRIAFFDPLRIIRISRRCHDEATLVFLPRRLDFGEMNLKSPGEQGNTALSLRSNDREDFSHVREYILGDALQLVHWKLTAKTEELMIKQYEQTSRIKALILCDYQFPGADSGSRMKQADIIIETALAIALSAVRTGTEVLIDFGTETGEYRSEIKDMPAFERFYNFSALIPSKAQVRNFCGLIAETMLAQSTIHSYSVVFLTTTHLTEELIIAAEAAAEGFPGIVALVNCAPGTNPALEEKASQQIFEYLPIAESK